MARDFATPSLHCPRPAAARQRHGVIADVTGLPPAAPGQMQGLFTMVGLLPRSADGMAYVTEQLGRQLGSRQDA